MKKLIILLLLVTLMILTATAALAQSASADDLVDKTKEFGDWLRTDLFGTIGLFGFLIGAGLVIFGNTGGLQRIGLVLVVLCLVAAYDTIWDTLKSFFG